MSEFDSSAFLATVPHSSGVYRMYNSVNTIIYIGKAKDLKKRLSQYFLKDVNSLKTLKLVSNISHIEFTVTFSESEALILECNLIKKFSPKYNILLKDDKSYPYIFLSEGKHPRINSHRGAKIEKGEYFGPFPSSGAVRDSLHLIQKIFPIRQCADNIYRNRSRPCLMYQLGRCLAPCIKEVCSDRFYQEQVNLLRLFLQGKNQEVLNQLVLKMEQQSENLEFEEAAKTRDQLLALRKIQEQQSVCGEIDNDIDVLGVAISEGIASVHVLFIRNKKILGTRNYFPNLPLDNSIEELTSNFLTQFYLHSHLGRSLPQEIICSLDSSISEPLTTAIKEIHKVNVKILSNVRSERAKYLRLAQANAEASLKAKASHINTIKDRINAFEETFGIYGIERMECYDISHTMGELTVASCVVFNREGPNTKEYRRFNIAGITPGDDFAAMNQVLTRRFLNIKNSEIPQIVFIDGGLGQLHEAENIISEMFSNQEEVVQPTLIGIAKGEGRKPGLETLIMGYTHEEYSLSIDNPALQLVLHIRDESHRFAITGHRNKRQQSRTTSRLQDIPGIGAKRRQTLLKHLGGMQEIFKSSADELAKVPGISKRLAQEIYDFLHTN
ncbi:MAG: excinuclease ABC subunit UvrC [Succinivibrionaceae bacterium]